MLIRLGYEIVFETTTPVPMVLLLYTHPSRAADLEAPETITVTPGVPIYDYTDWIGNRCARIIAPPGTLRLTSDFLIRDSGELDPMPEGATQHAVEDLPDETLQFLLGSRYCEVDKLSDIAWNLFGQTPLGWPRVQAVLNWVHGNVTFGYPFASPTKTAFDVYTQRNGVCRDFQHLAITFLRALNIPARYATGYLGDIGVPVSDSPMDFSAWFEAYLGGQWWTMDARHNKPRIGRVLMARGRDAADAALTTQFGSARLDKFVVVTDEVGN